MNKENHSTQSFWIALIAIVLVAVALTRCATNPAALPTGAPSEPVQAIALPPGSEVNGDAKESFSGVSDKVLSLAKSSSCAKYSWRDRGTAPVGYIQGVALTYARAVCDFKRGDAAARLVARPMSSAPESVRDRTDALSWFNSDFAKLGMKNAGDDIATLRHAFTLLIGLGLRESSGRHCCGRDGSASNFSSTTVEAGAWQTSLNSQGFSSELPKLFARYRNADHPACFLETFHQGVKCPASDLKNWGSGDGLAFQALEKDCPAFAAEYAAIMLRVSGGTAGHYGPLRTKKVEIRAECDQLLQQVEKVAVCE